MMMRSFQRLTFLLENFTLGSPAQQLLDRFLIGFDRDGTFVPSRLQVSAWCNQPAADSALLERRQAEFSLRVAAAPEQALQDADAVVIVPSKDAYAPQESLVRLALEKIPASTPVFVHGLLGTNSDVAGDLLRTADRRRCPLLAGTAVPHTFRLPDVDIGPGTRLREGLIVVQGSFPGAELNALEGLLPLLERRAGGEAGIRHVQSWPAGELWRTVDEKHWTWPLLAAAISRSDTPQGNPVLDGRTEDLVGLGLLPKLAPQGRGWLLDHADGLQSALLVLDGAVADINFALRLHNHDLVSAQLFRPPSPQQEQYSRLAAVLTEFFSTGYLPWPKLRTVRQCQLIAAMSSAEASQSAGIALSPLGSF